MSGYCNCGSRIKHTKYEEETRDKSKAKILSTKLFIDKIANFIRRTPRNQHVYISIIDRANQPMTKRVIKALSSRVDLGRNWDENIHYESFCCCYREKSQPLIGTKYTITDSYDVYKNQIHNNHIIIHDCMRTPRYTLDELMPLFANDEWKRLMIIAVFTKSRCPPRLQADIKGEVAQIAKNKAWLSTIGNEQRYRGAMYYIDIRLARI
ncbi:hypothetical protein D5b_00403 [Faustovirus]|nr:hypothetical protein D5b_00403 [Faustovirus]AMN84512.1 hypothetical protein D6_00102 [Faustovirus]AMP44346.1 hypothetical protein PRJ_Dakar_00394 [Faustovirus]